jgi:hypothetical protein
MMLTFDMVFLPLFIVAMAAAGIVTGRKRRARLLQERARNDQQRFLRMGFLRKRARQEEQRSLPVNVLRTGAK